MKGLISDNGWWCSCLTQDRKSDMLGQTKWVLSLKNNDKLHFLLWFFLELEFNSTDVLMTVLSLKHSLIGTDPCKFINTAHVVYNKNAKVGFDQAFLPFFQWQQVKGYLFITNKMFQSISSSSLSILPWLMVNVLCKECIQDKVILEWKPLTLLDGSHCVLKFI